MPGAVHRLREGADVALVSTGPQTSRVLAAADLLGEDGIAATVVHVPVASNRSTPRPCVAAIGDVPLVVTVEEHSVYGGLGGLVAEVLTSAGASPRIDRIGLDDVWGESAGNDFLLEKHGLSPARIADRVPSLLPAAHAAMTRRASYQVDVIAGDGIGQEVVPAAIRCVDAVASRPGLRITWRERDWGSDHYRAHGRMMPVDGIDQLADGDAILLGAVGAPGHPRRRHPLGPADPDPPGVPAVRQPAPGPRSCPGVQSPLRNADGLDMLIVRENVEGEYSEVGGRLYRGRPEEMAVQEAVFTRHRRHPGRGVRRGAGARPAAASLTSATKSNGIIHTMPFWDEVVAEVVGAGRRRHPGQDAGRRACRPGRAQAAAAST